MAGRAVAIAAGVIDKVFVAARGTGVDLPPARRRPAGREIAEGTTYRTIFMATRAADATRPSVQALHDAVRDAAAALGSLPLGV